MFTIEALVLEARAGASSHGTTPLPIQTHPTGKHDSFDPALVEFAPAPTVVVPPGTPTDCTAKREWCGSHSGIPSHGIVVVLLVVLLGMKLLTDLRHTSEKVGIGFGAHTFG